MAGAGKRGPGMTADVAGRLGPTVSVVIPAKNEALNLPDVLAGLPADLYEVILVDGYSSDDTVSVAQRLRPGITIVGQSRKGKGNALACGFAVATGDFIVMLDADGSTDPSEIPRFVEALMSGADFAKGSRFMPGGGSADISRIRRIGNFWLNWIVNVLYGTRYTDMCYGYNAFRRECLDVMRLQAGDTAYDEVDTEFQPNLGPDRRDVDVGGETTMVWGDGFEVETLINVRIAKAGLRVVEVPSFERCRNFGTSNLNAFSDGMRVFRTIRAEWKRGTRKDAIASAEAPREVGASWSVLSTLTEEAS
jgi:glycosyltransferase involved in cell wall biosynthesis